MAEYIDKMAAIKAINKYCEEQQLVCGELWAGLQTAKQIILAEKRHRARFMKSKGCYIVCGSPPVWKCSSCSTIICTSKNPPDYNYCPWCGAKITSSKEDTDNA